MLAAGRRPANPRQRQSRCIREKGTGIFAWQPVGTIGMAFARQESARPSRHDAVGRRPATCQRTGRALSASGRWSVRQAQDPELVEGLALWERARKRAGLRPTAWLSRIHLVEHDSRSQNEDTERWSELTSTPFGPFAFRLATWGQVAPPSIASLRLNPAGCQHSVKSATGNSSSFRGECHLMDDNQNWRLSARNVTA